MRETGKTILVLTAKIVLALALLSAAGLRAQVEPAGSGATPRAALGAGVCTPSATVLCLDGGRFRVAVSWKQAGGQSGVGSVVGGSTSDSGLFWFFSPANYEMMVKVLDGCAVNGRHWIFYLATTNVGFTLTVTDSVTQATKTYTNAAGTVPAVVTDTAAFASCS